MATPFIDGVLARPSYGHASDDHPLWIRGQVDAADDQTHNQSEVSQGALVLGPIHLDTLQERGHIRPHQDA